MFFSDNNDFYPTPDYLVEEMVKDLDFRLIKSVLEPSAGKGDILEGLKKRSEQRCSCWYSDNINLDIDCIEKDPNLRQILKGNNYRVVHDDFLSYSTMKLYDLIIMNPPFSDGCKHLLKALDMQRRNGGAIICLLNAETLLNPYTKERQVLNGLLNTYHADVKYIRNAFLKAERKTNVNIAIIKVQLPEVKRESVIINNLRKATEQSEYENVSTATQIAEKDFLKAIVKQYEMEVKAGIQLIKEYHAMAPYILRCFGKDRDTGETIQTGECVLSLNIGKDMASINGYVRVIREKYWSALFHNPNFVGQLTGNMQRDNIYELKSDIQQKVVVSIENTIVDLFDELSHKYSYYDETGNNIHYYNGWKTNKAWIINKKVIIPLNAFNSYSWKNDFCPSQYDVLTKLQDIEKCFNYLDGGLTESVDLRNAIEKAETERQTKNIDLKYFKITFYKKGTCHIQFKNMELLKKFNIFGSQHKGWLPSGYGKKRYEQMDQEEQQVIDEFEGKEEYQKVCANIKYYIFDSSSFMLLEEKENI